MKRLVYISCFLASLLVLLIIIESKYSVVGIMGSDKTASSARSAGRKKDAGKSKVAVAISEKTDPFYGLYDEDDLDEVSFEGTILAASVIPDPEENDYDNCLYAVFVELDSILSSSSFSEKTEQLVIINVPIMKDRTIVQSNLFQRGDKIACACAEYDAMPQEIQEIQISDDIQSFELQQYYALAAEKISSFQQTGNRNFAKREISITPIQMLSKDKKAISSRRERIQDEIKRIESELAGHGGSFERWKEEYRPIAEKYDQLCREEYKGWTNDSFFAAGGAETSYQTKDYIDGILPYKKYLEANNIDLIIVRVPSKGDFAARVLASDVFQENPAWVEHYYQCLKNDIEIVDPMPEMWKERFDFPLFYFYNSAEEPHPFEGEAFVSAKVLSDILKRYPYKKSKKKITLADTVFETDQPRFFWPAGNQKFDPSQNIVFKQVLRNENAIGGLSAGSDSPFLFLSNSFFYYPQRYLGASLPGYTAYFIQAIPDWLYQDGTHNPMLRNLVAKSQLLNSRRAVIMVGHPDDWKGFPPLPRYIQDHAGKITLEKTLHPVSEEITIHDNDLFQHSLEQSNAVVFIPNDSTVPPNDSHFDLEFQVPAIEGKKTCMIRVNFDRTSYIALSLVPEQNGTMIDTCTLAPGEKVSADLFMPLPDQPSVVKVLLQPKHILKEYTVRNVELWYY